MNQKWPLALPKPCSICNDLGILLTLRKEVDKPGFCICIAGIKQEGLYNLHTSGGNELFLGMKKRTAKMPVPVPPNTNEQGEFLDSFVGDAARRILEAQRLLFADYLKSEGQNYKRNAFIRESIQYMEWFVDEYK